MRKLLLPFLLACGPGLHATDIGGDTEKPALVRVLLTVDVDKKPITDLTRANFDVYEDEELVGDQDTVVAMPDMASSQYTLVLLDFSGGIVGSPDVLVMIDGAKTMMKDLRPKQKAAVYVFDGAPDLVPVVQFSTPEGSIPLKLDGLKDFRPRDATSNLNGAIVAAMKTLRGETGPNLTSGGALVLVYRDQDHAGRVTAKDLETELKKPEYARIRRYAIGIGEDAKKAKLGSAASTASVLTSGLAVDGEMQKVGKELAQLGSSYYFLGVCSKARAGEHELRIEINRVIRNEKGSEVVQRGTLKHKFNADGFNAGCAPKVPTDLEIKAPPPPPVEEKDAGAAPPPATAHDAGKG